MREIEFAKRLHRFLKLLQTGALQGLDRFTANTKNLGDFLHLEPRKLKTYDFLCTMRQICHLTLQTTIQLDYSVFVVIFKILLPPIWLRMNESTTFLCLISSKRAFFVVTKRKEMAEDILSNLYRLSQNLTIAS